MNDAGVFNNCDFRTELEQGNLRWPQPMNLPDSDIICPFYIIVDAGFPLYRYLITPYAGMQHLTPSQQIFNRRHSRARRIIECAFALLVQKWRVFSKPLGFLLSSSETIILATMTLHNYLIHTEVQVPVAERRYVLEQNAQLDDDLPDPENMPYQNDRPGDEIRELLRNWCVTEGNRQKAV